MNKRIAVGLVSFLSLISVNALATNRPFAIKDEDINKKLRKLSRTNGSKTPRRAIFTFTESAFSTNKIYKCVLKGGNSKQKVEISGEICESMVIYYGYSTVPVSVDLRCSEDQYEKTTCTIFFPVGDPGEPKS